MDLVEQPIPILVAVSLASMGMVRTSSPGEFVHVPRRPALLFRSRVAVDVIPLVAAIAIIALFPGRSLTFTFLFPQ